MSQWVDKNSFQLVERAPTAHELLALRESVGWHVYPVEIAEQALRESLFAVSLLIGGEVVGCARVIGDAYYRYVQDVIVKPAWQGKGGGSLMMDRIHRWLVDESAGRYRGLTCPPKSVNFYRRYQFQPEGVAMTFHEEVRSGSTE